MLLKKLNVYKVRGRIWIESDNGTFIGYGRVILLERIQQFGSITEAAKSMKMSYRNAWEMVGSMNKQSKQPLVETAAGGVGGGGTKLTREGEKAIQCFRELYERFKQFNGNETEKLDL